ncbi:MAG: ABC transporter ATP-binding protein [Candidatus Dactylopiibacterium carminicum]|uniref:ABC transporter ATP-binding protein n=1 Tax=Candidatus Dactylopiibacterium carminicum TaxID=857335 RepID=A0A272EQN5_9RHOO|nr:ABC transporter ATP-binding protein [Candidatus Dactylopiibacterium carminicum]KAF7598613.1 ABC transporter ATP-binding protein [Candidatus Dactylopiibacterium carminicum]PAS92366.1 MAG: ABC transporter ATP-binding protein [Candidatus Dactylopiibacterium carminicum]PAS98378.1 MAG: ABC transporter ATP-binding protein [Candidatus Dactylopiibacterium carminicum]
MPLPVLQVHDLHLAYGDNTVVHGVDFALASGAIACLLGPSGCGKTTVLRAIAGFERPRAGHVRLKGETIASPDLMRPPEARGIGMVFQDYALFPHLDVAANIAFGLAPLPRARRHARVEEMLALVSMQGTGGRYPHELSGGQQQRIALARALAPRPELILLDEPFSNLDTEMRERLSFEVRDILKAAGTAAILVTHDQHEAFAMADEIGVMSEGRLAQWAEPWQLYHRPATRFVADFVGQGVIVPGVVHDARTVEIELGRLRSDIPVECCGNDGECRVDVLLRPDDVVHDDASPLRAVVARKAFKGAEILYTLRLASGAEVLSLVPSYHDHAIGQPIGIRLDADRVVTFAHR